MVVSEPVKTIRFYLVRHGDAYNEEGIQLDDFPLNNYGKVQSLQLARRLKDNKFDAMYCSKKQRAMDTCEIVNEYHEMKVNFNENFNEVGNPDWPMPGAVTLPQAIDNFKTSVEFVGKFFKKFVKDCRKKGYKEVIVFTHGNWIRVLLTRILSHNRCRTFSHFIIHNTSLTIIDVDENGYEYIITVSDAAHTQLFKFVI